MNLSTVFSNRQLWVSIALLFLLKTATVTSLRVIYPFASFFADEMGVSIGQFFGALSIGEIISAGCPFLGPLAERVGPRRMLVWAGGCSAVALAGMGLAVKSFAGFIVAWTAYNCAVAFVFGAGGAFVGLFVPARSRTRATAAAECSWGAASFAGQIFVGWVISNASYGWAYYSMGIFTAVVVCAMYFMFKFVDARQTVAVLPVLDTAVTAATITVRPASSSKLVSAVDEFHLDTLGQCMRDDAPAADRGRLRDLASHVATSPEAAAAASTSSGSKRSALKFGASARYLKQHQPAAQLSLLRQFGVVFKDASAVALLCGVLAAIAVAAVAFSNYGNLICTRGYLSFGTIEKYVL